MAAATTTSYKITNARVQDQYADEHPELCVVRGALCVRDKDMPQWYHHLSTLQSLFHPSSIVVKACGRKATLFKSLRHKDLWTDEQEDQGLAVDLPEKNITLDELVELVSKLSR